MWLALKTKYFEETWFLFSRGFECRRWVGKEGVLWKQVKGGKKSEAKQNYIG